MSFHSYRIPLLSSLFLWVASLPLNIGRADASEPWQFGFQDPATPVMEGIINLHHDLMFFLTIILFFVMWVMGRTLWFFENQGADVYLPEEEIHATFLEIAWTVTPSLVLIFIAVPSFALLYAMDEIFDPAMTLKCIGHQWYWSYEYSDYNSDSRETLAFDSYMLPEDELESGQLRLLEVDNRVVVPVKTHIRVITTAVDVLHCWALPAAGIKMDAVPGRLNQTSMFFKREGVYYGQCSEICGVNHGFMPIVVEAVNLQDYVQWVTDKLEDA